MCRLLSARPLTSLALLLKGRANAVELTQEQCACLMVHCFFCSMPFRSSYAKKRSGGGGGGSSSSSHQLDLPDFSFVRIHGVMGPPRAEGASLSANQAQKWLCLLHYFTTLATRAEAAPPPEVKEEAGAAGSSSATENGPPLLRSGTCIFALIGFAAEEFDDLANELRTAGARQVLDTFDPTVCTHLLCEDAPTSDDAAVEAIAEAVEAARKHGVHIVSPEWLNQQTRVTAPLANNAYASRKGGVRFERLVLDTSDHDLDAWSANSTALCDVKAASHGTIEDAGPDVLHLDFANAYMGGGVLGQGCVQEEIRFLICPELIVSRLLCERLQDNEATLFQGFERFSTYTGYAKSFAYAGPYADEKRADRRPPLLAIDATHFRYGSNLQQFGDPSIERELNKALAGFTPSPSEGSLNLPLCTGNWGCGAFGGDLQMKALIQLLAASLANRPCMHYLHVWWRCAGGRPQPPRRAAQAKQLLDRRARQAAAQVPADALAAEAAASGRLGLLCGPLWVYRAQARPARAAPGGDGGGGGEAGGRSDAADGGGRRQRRRRRPTRRRRTKREDGGGSV